MIKTQSEKKQNPFSGFRFGKMLLVLGVALMISVCSFAQGPGDDDLGGDPDLPFDGGVSLLVAAGVAYGAKQWRNARKKEDGTEAEKEL